MLGLMDLMQHDVMSMDFAQGGSQGFLTCHGSIVATSTTSTVTRGPWMMMDLAMMMMMMMGFQWNLHQPGGDSARARRVIAQVWTYLVSGRAWTHSPRHWILPVLLRSLKSRSFTHRQGQG